MKHISTLLLLAALVLCVHTTPAQGYVSVGGYSSASSSVPMDCDWEHTVSQFIYKASEIGSGPHIFNSIELYH